MKFSVILLLMIPVFAFPNVGKFLPDNFSIGIDQVHRRFGNGKEVRVPVQLDYSYPGKMKYLNKKRKSLFVCNKDSSWYYVPPHIKGESGSVKVNSGSSFRLVNLFDSLRAGLKSNDLYTVKKKKENQYLLSFSKKAQKEFNITKVDLYISDVAVKRVSLNSKGNRMPKKKKAKKQSQNTFFLGDLAKLKITYRDKKALALEFKDFKSGVKFTNSHFIFSIPEKTKIIR